MNFFDVAEVVAPLVAGGAGYLLARWRPGSPKKPKLRPIVQAIVTDMLTNPEAWKYSYAFEQEGKQYMAAYRSAKCTVSVSGDGSVSIYKPVQTGLSTEEALAIDTAFQTTRADMLMSEGT